MDKEALSSGRLVVGIHKHSVAVIDGVVHDTADCSLDRWGKPPWVWGYFEKRAAIKDSVLSPERKRLIDIVSKLIALSEGGTTDAEADSAKTKAAELIARYNIEFDSTGGLEEYEAIVEFQVGRVPSYKIALLHNLSPFCGVLSLTGDCKNGGTYFKLFGKSQDIKALGYMREIVSAQFDHAWMAYLETEQAKKRDKAAWGNSFADGVEEKVKDLMKAAVVQQKALRKDLVLVPRHKQAKTEYEILFGKFGGHDDSANAHGLESGRNVSLSKGVHSSGGVLQIAHRK